jgi:hypothetical protein
VAQLGVRRGTVRVRRGSVRVRRSSDSSASAYCKAVPSSNLARHPRGGPLPSKSNEEIKIKYSTSSIHKYYVCA